MNFEKFPDSEEGKQFKSQSNVKLSSLKKTVTVNFEKEKIHILNLELRLRKYSLLAKLNFKKKRRILILIMSEFNSSHYPTERCHSRVPTRV